MLRGNRAADTIVIVEGEPAADAVLAACDSAYAVLTWRGGASVADKADLSSVKDKTVLLWPDNDSSGREAMRIIARRCWAECAYAVRLIEPPAGEKWDAADLPSPRVKKELDAGGRRGTPTVR